MIARLFPASNLTVDTGGKEALGKNGIEKEMVDTQAGVPTPRVPKIVPEGVDAFGRIQRAHGIRLVR